MRARSDAQIRALTGLFRTRLAGGEPAEALLPEAFAAVREAAVRTIGERPFDMQVMGGAVLHLGKVAEMQAGEGKTLTATMPAYLNALSGEPVHVMTADGYLARRDASRMAPVYRFLGLEVGVVLPEMPPEERRRQYAADVAYGHSYEFGFDYLRDNMAWSPEDCVQRGLHYAIADDGDSILLNEARAPLMISGPAELASASEGRMTFAEIMQHDYLRLYPRLAALSGVAATESGAYRDAYGLEVVTIPASRPTIRIDHLDAVYTDARGKLNGIGAEVAARHAAGQPVLVGTISAGQSEAIAALLSQRGITHEVLGAQDPQHDARILAEAARPGAVTVATLMTGRGIDIRLGGADGAARDTVANLGGLCVLGAEHHWLRRVDSQLRDLAGRRGEPGESKFFFSLEDDFFARFFPPKASARMRHRVKEGAEREITSEIGYAQAALEAQTMASLLAELEYDDVLARQQRVFYDDRRIVLLRDGLRDRVRRMIDEVIRDRVTAARNPADTDLWRELRALYPVSITPGALAADRGRAPGKLPPEFVIESVCADAQAAYDRREADLGADILREVETRVMLSVADRKWREHLQRMHGLCDEIRRHDLRGGNRLDEYRREAAQAFTTLRRDMREESVGNLFNLQIEVVDPGQAESAG